MHSNREMFLRRSERNIKSKRSYSPETDKKLRKQSTIKKPKGTVNLKEDTVSLGHSNTLPTELLNNQSSETISCEHCKTPFSPQSIRKWNRKSCATKQSYSRQTCNPIKSQMLNLCISCGTPFQFKCKPKKKKQLPSFADKEKYLHEANTFARSLVEVLQDPDAERLFCPEFKNQPCACLQKYVLSDVNESQHRALCLLQFLKEAKKLSQQKSYSLEEVDTDLNTSNKNDKPMSIGLGNGQKRSKDFESFILEKRLYLREELRLCERATQRVLMYSNNFLHKRLKTEPQRGSRIKRKKGKAALGLLKPIPELATGTCCLDNCILMALTHATLLQQWRERSSASQAEAWRVLGEMLTPCAGGRSNCFKFIAMVTGCSSSTISKVNDQMKSTGGEREPPEHGLKRWWQEQAKKFHDNQQIDHCSESNDSTSFRINNFRKKKQSTKTLIIDEINEESNEVSQITSVLDDPDPAINSSPFVSDSNYNQTNLPIGINGIVNGVVHESVLRISPSQKEQLADIQRQMNDLKEDNNSETTSRSKDSESQGIELSSPQNIKNHPSVTVMNYANQGNSETLIANNLETLTQLTNVSVNNTQQTVHHLILDNVNIGAIGTTQFLSDGLGNIIIIQPKRGATPSGHIEY